MNVEKIRQDFPILQKKIIYFDNACMSLRPIPVIDKINEYYREYPACGGRSFHKLGKKVTDEVEKSRKIVGKFLNAKENEIVFTKNTTESINLVSNSLNLEKGDIVVTTDKEHNSNLLPWQLLKEKKGVNHLIVKSNPDNTFSLENFEKVMNKNIKLVSMVHTSNIDGVTIPLKEITKIAHDFGALVLVDAAQSVPHKEIHVKKLDVDFLACSGHKMMGPSGIGILYGKYDLLKKLYPFMVGGDTVVDTTYETHEFEKIPERFEAGLQHYSGIIGLGEAANYLMRIGRNNIEEHEKKLNKIITENLINNSEITLIGPQKPELRSGIFSFNIKNMDPHNIASMVDASKNICIRSGMHCVHSWFNAHGLKGSARASLYAYNTEEECKIFVDEVKKILKLAI